MTDLLALGSGSLVGFTLGLIGGGGSIMATPLLLYLVGMSPHVAIGTGALAYTQLIQASMAATNLANSAALVTQLIPF